MPPAATTKVTTAEPAGAPPRVPPPGDKTLTKGLQLLEALSDTEHAVGISELAQRLSLTKSNVHRLLQTLIRCGYVMREEGVGRYRLSAKLWRIARRGGPVDALQRAARPVLRTLVEHTGESIVFVVVENDTLILIDQVETRNPVRVFFSIGQSFPIDRVVMDGKGLTALQMIVLAGRSEAEMQAAARAVQRQLHEGEAFFRQQLEHILAVRQNGFAVSRGEWVAGANAVAVPVADRSQRLIGVVSCFGPAERLPDDRLAGDSNHSLRAGMPDRATVLIGEALRSRRR